MTTRQYLCKHCGHPVIRGMEIMGDLQELWLHMKLEYRAVDKKTGAIGDSIFTSQSCAHPGTWHKDSPPCLCEQPEADIRFER